MREGSQASRPTHVHKVPVARVPGRTEGERFTFWARARAGASMMGGRVLGMAQTMVTPPARAAAVPEAKSSLCVPPGSRRWTWTSINPGECEGQGQSWEKIHSR